MPLLHISLCVGKPETYRQAIFDSLYRAMRDALNVPEDDQFMTITEVNPVLPITLYSSLCSPAIMAENLEIGQ